MSCSHSLLGEEFLSSPICCVVNHFLLFVLDVSATKLIWWLLLLVLDETGNSQSLLHSGYCKIAHCEPLLSPYVTGALLSNSNSPWCTGAWWNFSRFRRCFPYGIRQTAQDCCGPFLSPTSSLPCSWPQAPASLYPCTSIDAIQELHLR